MALSKAQSEELLKKVQNRINDFLGSDVNNLSNISKLHEDWDSKRMEIEQSLSLASDEVPSKVGKITRMIEDTCSELSNHCHEISLVLTDISKETCRTDDLYLLLKENFDKISQLTNAHAYLSIIEFIEHLSNRMEGYVASRETNTGRAIDEYKKLGGLCVKINKTSCSHLRTYLIDTLKYWHTILKKDIVDDFGTCMKNVQWPLVSSNNFLTSPSADALSKFQHGLKRLLNIAIPYPSVYQYHSKISDHRLGYFGKYSDIFKMKDRFGSLSFAINDWKEFLTVSKQSFKKKLYMKSTNDVTREDFDIMRTLGSGSFGRVVLARRKNDSQYFAIKVLDKAKVLKTKQVEHTLNEKQILQAIRCPFTVYLEHFFQDNLYLFFVLPLILGGEMFSHLRKIGKFQENATKFYAAQVVLAFEYLHYLDLVYRDLKPENLLIDHVGYLKVTDFGFCKVLKKRTYTVCGTPEYLAPEIILRKGYGQSVDWWTLGVLIYEMAAGYPPFSAKDTMKLYERIVACKYHFPTNFSSDVKEIIKAILQVDISKRLGNLKGGAEDLKHHKYFKSIQWLPLCNKKLVSPFIPHVSSPSDVSNFQRCSEEPLAELDSHIVSSTLVVAFPTPTLPVVLLIQPLRKRFLFHFSGNSKTNRIDKPEWYFTQILTWIRDHESFILNWVQPVYDDMGVGKSALAEFMAGLVELSSEKLQVDIEQAQYDDVTFSHVVDEALAYERELRHTYLYPQALPGPVHILSQAQLFVKWLSMEKKYAREKMDIMIKSETAWSTLAGDADEDKVTEVAHSFLALLSTMSDRYSLLPQPGHRLQFVELVLEIIDDLRVSLLQVLHSEHNDPLNSKLPQVLNTVHHIRIAIEQYDASPAILLLNHYRTQFNGLSADDTGSKSRVNPLDEPAEGIFQSSLALLGRLESQLLTELCDNLMMEVKAKSRPYRKDKWYGMSEEDVDHSIVTLSGCGMYQALADQLHLVHGKITGKLFSTFWKMVANNVCLFFLDEIVLDNYFNAPGGQVLEKDVNKFLIPLFQHYCEVPGTYFAKLQEVCRILALPTLSHSVKRAALCGSGKELLAALDIPLIHLSGEKLCTVITRRVDVVPSLM